jgi:hypothetical protein
MDNPASKLGNDRISTFYLVRGKTQAGYLSKSDVEMMDNSQSNFITLHQTSKLGVDHIPTSGMIITIIN